MKSNILYKVLFNLYFFERQEVNGSGSYKLIDLRLASSGIWEYRVGESRLNRWTQ